MKGARGARATFDSFISVTFHSPDLPKDKISSTLLFFSGFIEHSNFRSFLSLLKIAKISQKVIALNARISRSRIIMEREREIRAFKAITFWDIFAILSKDKNDLKFECSIKPEKKSKVDEILSLGKSGEWKVTDIKESKVARAPRAPFITSTLQQSASSRFGLAPSRTMQLAQKLYEAGHITYMRTDSTNLGGAARRDIENLVNKKYGADYFESHVFAKKSKNAQEAHEAIRPTHMDMERAGANDAEQKLYSLIWQRTIASQMKSAEVMRTKVVANIDNGKIPDFWLNGSRILFDGWLKADPHSASEDVILPKLNIGDDLKLIDINSLEKQTEPPGRYSEAGLIKELEKRAIGRPSTYAP